MYAFLNHAQAALKLTLVLCYSHNPRNEAAEAAAAQTGKPGMVSASPSASVNPFQFALFTLLDLGEAASGDVEGGGGGGALVILICKCVYLYLKEMKLCGSLCAAGYGRSCERGC